MTEAADLDLPVFDYSAPDLVGEVYHRRLAETAAKGWLAQGPFSYVVLDREAGEFFLRSRAMAFPGREIAELFAVPDGRLREHIDANIINQNGERHRRLRALIGPAFTPRAANRARPAMRAFLDELWKPGATSCDFVPEIARPYPALTIAAVLGAPKQDVPRLHEWAHWVQRQFDIRALSEDLPLVEKAAAEMHEYVADLLAVRRAAPEDDLLSTLLAAEDEGDRLTLEECVHLVLNVMGGGIDTTQAQLSHALNLFAGHPDQWALLAAEPGLVGRAVDEVLRFEPITPFTARICVEPVEHRGVRFPAGAIVAVCAERANREEGEEFDITAEREHRPLTFGAGVHYCLGANLARAELEEALTFLAPRMPGLAVDGPVRFGGVEGIYGIESLPLTWSPSPLGS
ncbi:cytochrome P450 [Actinomadura rubrisoli]|uniref:Cytochrome P450 n=1 Tax=Actinomadura rubrisoli TaxID=2530368 RepID=A0A4R5C8W8_9ACTN|nr:cytochrome P450 [Actinomadura rubrisoli]TDD94620.1 cytochrome P450 [Actinomadura rubrisoli]